MTARNTTRTALTLTFLALFGLGMSVAVDAASDARSERVVTSEWRILG